MILMPMTSKTISKIKKLGDERSGSALLELMDFYNVNCLRELSEEQGQAFYKYKTKEDCKCAVCGREIPEGRMVCWICEK